MIGIDTNILVRLITRDDGDQAARAAATLSTHCSVDAPCRIDRIVLAELVWVLERGLRYPRREVADAIEAIVATLEFDVDHGDEVLMALEAYRHEGVDFADALLGLINAASGCSTTLTFDRRAARMATFQEIR